MKKLSLKNLKVTKLTSEEKKSVNAGKAQDVTAGTCQWQTSGQCNAHSYFMVSWCTAC